MHCRRCTLDAGTQQRCSAASGCPSSSSSTSSLTCANRCNHMTFALPYLPKCILLITQREPEQTSSMLYCSAGFLLARSQIELILHSLQIGRSCELIRLLCTCAQEPLQACFNASIISQGEREREALHRASQQG